MSLDRAAGVITAKEVYSKVAALLSSPRALILPADVRELLAAVALHLVGQASRLEALQLIVDRLTKRAELEESVAEFFVRNKESH